MSLSDSQIRELCQKMSVPLADCIFKDELKAPLQYNKTYIINMEDSHDEQGNENDGSHWVFLQCNKSPNDKIECIYFDPYGQPPPENVKEVVKKTTGKIGLPYTEKDVQSLMNNACGYFCLAMGHFINASQYRSNSLFHDVTTFMEMFDDLNTSIDFKKNEYILKHFFRSSDPNMRKAIEVIKPIESITSEDNVSNTPDPFKGVKLPVDIKMMPPNKK